MQNTKQNIQPLMLDVLQGKQTNRVPFWLMRQAGRYLPEYRALRTRAGSFLDLCLNPSFAAEVTLQPLQRFDMDAAILFSDILVIPYGFGENLAYVEGEGPKLDPLNLDPSNLHALSDRFDLKRLAPICETVARVRQDLSKDKILIGFAGGPWTVACYMIDGRGGTGFPLSLAASQNKAFELDLLIDLLTQASIEYLRAQVDAGAQALQIFDSWSGLLSPDGFQRWVIAPTKRITAALKQSHPHIPIIGFPRLSGPLYLDYANQTGVCALSLDHTTPLNDLPPSTVVQGDLDPQILLKGGAELDQAVQACLEKFKDRPHIFNLSHGVIKETPPDHVARLSKLIKDYRR